MANYFIRNKLIRLSSSTHGEAAIGVTCPTQENDFMEAVVKSVFVVTSGCYSDYRIIAIFTSRSAAQKYIDAALKAKRDDDDNYDVINVHWAAEANVEEWPLNDQRKAVVCRYWRLGMLLDDGSVCEQAAELKEFGIPAKSEILQYAVKVPCYGDRPIVRVKSMKSASHALKMAAEARQKWLREGKPSSVTP